MNISDEDMAVLAHKVIDPNEWIRHALDTAGERAVIEKINRWRNSYLQAKREQGVDYKTRAEREQDSILITSPQTP